MPARISNPIIAGLGGALAGRYFIARELGHGRTASVYLAHDDKHGRPVAVKVLDVGIAAEVGADLFLREIRLLAQLQHPHILPLYDSGESDGVLYFVMPYVERESLRERLARDGRIPLPDAARIVREIAEALDYAHRQGVVHRDIKPENLLLDGEHTLVADFGIARAITRASGERTTAAGQVLGTPPYMSPEQAIGAADLDGRADVFSLGVVLYEMLAGAPPWTSSSARAILQRRDTPPPLRAPGISPEVERVVLKALARAPSERWSTALELATALDTARRRRRRTGWRRWLPW